MRKKESITELERVGLADADLEFEEFDSAEFLTTKESMAAYLSHAALSGDAEHFKAAMKTAARAQTMAKIAAEAGITREGAYKALKLAPRPNCRRPSEYSTP